MTQQPGRANAVEPLAEVVCTLPDGSQRVAPISPGCPMIVGRAHDCPLVMSGDAKASRRHLSFEVRGKDVYVTDLGSRNGIRVNGARVGEARVGPGDEIHAGSCKLEVRPTRGTILEIEPSFCASCGRMLSVDRRKTGPRDDSGRPLCA